MTTLTRADMAALDALEAEQRATARAARLSRSALRDLRQWGDAGSEHVRLRYVARCAAPAWRARRRLYVKGGMANQGKSGTNQHRERLWFSPHCLKPKSVEDDDKQQSLFGGEP